MKLFEKSFTKNFYYFQCFAGKSHGFQRAMPFGGFQGGALSDTPEPTLRLRRYAPHADMSSGRDVIGA
ncbi:hypothetical protein [Gluconacetobacter entanii]|uniref:hypothetical protein n=1 Tax=Gluconacetobacter entanii TaxID=108528 RepID=UPI0011B44BA4|nr:hypothetical protein [Gluconacetobacter entanii]